MKGRFSTSRPAVSRRVISTVYRLAAVCALVAGCIATSWAQGEVQAGVVAGRAFGSVPATAPSVLRGRVFVPQSSMVAAEDKGKRAHTNVRLMIPVDDANPFETPPYSGYLYETPASLACIYGLVTQISGCDPNLTVNQPTGGSQTIAVVDAYDNPTVAGDLAYFSAQFGIPFSPSKFHVVYATPDGSAPPIDISGGWELESALDVEYAHAMAPKANLYLVEARSNSFSDLASAVQVAVNLIRCGQRTACPSTATGKGEISMSWGGEEWGDELRIDAAFVPSTAPGVVFLAATGDYPGTSYPSVSPYVIAVGGTTIARSLSTGKVIKEISWSDAGGGISPYEAAPAYQTANSAVKSMIGTRRGTPECGSGSKPGDRRMGL